jgi:hypothetical protein
MEASRIIRDIVGIKKVLPKKSIYAKDWLSWYRGKVIGYHNYRIYNGSNYLDLTRKTLGMPKFICESWANLLMNERCDIILPDAEKDKLDKILSETNFWQKANDGIEKSFALGIGAMVVGIENLRISENRGTVDTTKGKVSIDFINETKIFPITIKNRTVTECAFISKNSDETNVVVHVLNENKIYEIHNFLLDDKNQIKQSFVFNTKSEIPWFFILRPNISSNFITELVDEEIGISIYANSLDVLMSIDNKYDGFDLEYVLGRKRMYISTEAWTINTQDGTQVRTFDPYDQLYYHLPDNDDGKPLITTKSDDLRFDAYVRGINTELSLLSMKCGLGENFFKFDGSSISTATQVISENSTLFRNIKKHEILLEDVLKNITKVIIKASNDFTSVKFANIHDDEIRIQFNDSIFEDRNAEMDRDRLDVQAGIMSVPEYREKWYGEDEDTSKEKYQNHFLYAIANNYLQALTSGAMTPAQYCEIVYPNAQNKEEITEYILNFIGTADVQDMEYLYKGDGGEEDGLQEEEQGQEEAEEELDKELDEDEQEN